jgi:hypothetical protein
VTSKSDPRNLTGTEKPLGSLAFRVSVGGGIKKTLGNGRFGGIIALSVRRTVGKYQRKIQVFRQKICPNLWIQGRGLKRNVEL